MKLFQNGLKCLRRCSWSKCCKMAMGQKDANPWGPQVAVGSISPFTNRLFWVPGIFDPHPNVVQYIFSFDPFDSLVLTCFDQKCLGRKPNNIINGLFNEPLGQQNFADRTRRKNNRRTTRKRQNPEHPVPFSKPKKLVAAFRSLSKKKGLSTRKLPFHVVPPTAMLWFPKKMT